jgi:hypothetical protein
VLEFLDEGVLARLRGEVPRMEEDVAVAVAEPSAEGSAWLSTQSWKKTVTHDGTSRRNRFQALFGRGQLKISMLKDR